jgi:hypothetical protein
MTSLSLYYQHWQSFFCSTVKEIKQSFLSVHKFCWYSSLINLDLSLPSLPLPSALPMPLPTNLIRLNDAVKFALSNLQTFSNFCNLAPWINKRIELAGGFLALPLPARLPRYYPVTIITGLILTPMSFFFPIQRILFLDSKLTPRITLSLVQTET